MPAALSVNVNKIALLRNARDTGIPSVDRLALIAIDAGCHGITVHPRPDQRHVRPHDVHELSALCRAHGREFNIEGYPSPGFLDLVHTVGPHQCTLVPDRPDQRTSDHGWDVEEHIALLERTVHLLHARGVRVSVFLDPDPDQVERVVDTGADRIELYTEPWAKAYAAGRGDEEIAAYVAAAEVAARHNLGVNAGHDLDLANLPPFARRIPNLREVSIGHALIADALEFGMAETVRKYLAALRTG